MVIRVLPGLRAVGQERRQVIDFHRDFYGIVGIVAGISHEDVNPWDDRELEEDSHRRNFAFAFFGEGLHNLAVI